MTAPKTAAAPAAAAVLVVLLLAGGLLLAASAPALPAVPAAPPAESGGLYAKVVRVDGDARELELTLIVQPKETRVVFSGEPPRVLAGDYVSFRIQNNKAKFAGAEMTCSRIIWVLP